MPITDWVTIAEATSITGEVFTETELENAGDDVWSHIRWTPEFGIDLVGDDMRPTMQRIAIRNAIAWQAYHRKHHSPTSLMHPVTSESIGEYSVAYASPVGGEIMGPRPRDILATAGLMRRVGHTHPRGTVESELLSD